MKLLSYIFFFLANLILVRCHEVISSEMVEIVSSFVRHFHHPCVTIITTHGMIKVQDVKKLFSDQRVQVVYTSSHNYHLETIQTWSECGHFLWFGNDGPSPGPLLAELWRRGESGGIYY